MTLPVVVSMVGGFAREDASTPSVVGAYTNPELAAKLAIIRGFGSVVLPVEVDVIPPGLLQDAEAMKIALPPLKP